MVLLPVEEAIARVTSGLAPLAAESVPLGEALDRVLADDLVATRDQPPFPASAMDGYAVRAGDVRPVPFSLKVIGEVPAGSPFGGKVGAGEAVRIFTGAAVPDGADFIIIQEHTEPGDGIVTIVHQPANSAFIRAAGLDFGRGETVLSAGAHLGPRALALAAAVNAPVLSVRRKPKVAILATGDELVLPGDKPGPGQIISSNTFGIGGFVERLGGMVMDLGIARDTMDDLRDKAGAASGADILVTLGGASVGDHDLVRPALEQLGLKVDFWRIAMRPGKPLMFGEMGAMKLLGLPGNPVSSFVCAHVFLRPMLARLLGTDASEPRRESVILGADLPENDERQDYLRATLEHHGSGPPTALPFSRQDSSLLKRLAKADCLIVRAPHAPAARAGDTADCIRLDF